MENAERTRHGHEAKYKHGLWGSSISATLITHPMSTCVPQRFISVRPDLLSSYDFSLSARIDLTIQSPFYETLPLKSDSWFSALSMNQSPIRSILLSYFPSLYPTRCDNSVDS
jgi:hypothetical protein